MSGFGGAVKLTGESEYRNALKKITQNLKEVSSEMKLVSSSYDKNDKSVTALTAKQTALTNKLDQQKSKLSMVETAYADMSKQYQDNQTKHETLVAEYDKESAKLEQIGKELGTDSKEYQEQQKVVDALAKEVQDSTKAQDANEKALSNMRIEMNKSQADINKTERELNKLDNELEEAKRAEENASKGIKDMNRSMKDTKGATDSANGGFTVLKGTLANLASQGIQAVANAMKNLGNTAYDAWKEYDEGADIIIAKTGATGKSAEELETAYRTVSKNVVGSFDEMGTAVGEINTRFGATGSDLETLSGKFLKFAKLNGTDVNGSIDTAQKALSAFGLGTKDAGHVLDVFNKVGQDTGVSMDSLMDGLIQNGTAFQEMGLSIEDSIVLMGQMEKSGANSETVMNGLRKALKSATADGIPLNEALTDLEASIVNNKSETDGLAKAYEIFGKSGDQIYGALKNGTLSFKDISSATLDFKDSIDKTYESTLDGSDRFDLALQGLRSNLAELTDNLMSQFAPQIESAFSTISKVVETVFSAVEKGMGFVIKNGNLIISILGGLTAGIGAYLAYTTALTVMTSGWKALAIAQKASAVAQRMVNVAMSANPIGLIVSAVVALVTAFVVLWKRSSKFRNFWKKLWEEIKKIAEPIIKGIADAFKKAWDMIVAVWNKAKSFFQGVWNGIKAVFSGVILYYQTIFTGAVTAIKTVFTGLITFFKTLWSGIKAVFTGVASYFSGRFKTAVTNIKTAFNGIKSWFSGLWSGIKGVFDGVASYFSGRFKSAVKAIKSAFSGIVGFFGGIWSKIKDKFTSLGTTIGSAISGAVKGGINKVIAGAERVINKAIGLINGAIGVINKLPGVNVSRVGKVSFPRLATGGVLERGQIGFLEGDGAEAVVPLEKNTKWIKRVADDMRTALITGANVRESATMSSMGYDDAVRAFQDAMTGMKIVLDDEVAGKFVTKTITNVIYS